jgi:hypothetical protein
LSAVCSGRSKSKPTRAARLLSLKARISAGRASGTPSNALGDAAALVDGAVLVDAAVLADAAARSRALICSQAAL